MLESILALEHFSEDRDTLEAGIVADSMLLRVDADGRLVLPEDMVGQLALGENVAFLGKGDRFEIWDAEAARAHVAEARRRVLEKRLTLAATPLHTTPRGMP
jgi:MraZ protein